MRAAATTRRILAAGAVVAALFVAPGPSLAAYPSTPRALSADPIATGLDFPAAFTFAPDGRIFYGERYTGEIRIFDPANGSATHFFTISNLSINGEQGLLGLALAPGYPTQSFLFAYATRDVPSGLRNQIIRLRDNGGTGSSPKIIFSSDTTAGSYHDGGRILFGPDQRLYAVVGEGHDSSNSQDLSNNAGKILRMTAKGGVPPDNPFAGKLIWSYGHRNSFGFTFDPLTDLLWETENGPECNDEINLIAKGANFGWGPSETCSEPPPPPQNTNQDGPDPVLPLSFFTPTIAPVGTAFCVGCGIPSAEGAMLFAAYNTDQIRQVTLTPDRMGIQSIATVYTHSSFVLSMERGPDDAVYFSDGGAIYHLIGT
jgi:aldose sugar dehydrogenase